MLYVGVFCRNGVQAGVKKLEGVIRNSWVGVSMRGLRNVWGGLLESTFRARERAEKTLCVVLHIVGTMSVETLTITTIPYDATDLSITDALPAELLFLIFFYSEIRNNWECIFRLFGRSSRQSS